MAILPFLLGLVPLIVSEELDGRLPADPEPWKLVVTLPVLAIPALLARLRGLVIVRERLRGRVTRVISRLLELTSTALAFAVWLYAGGGLDFVDAVDRHGPIVRGSVMILPLLVAELARLTAARESARRMRKIGFDDLGDPPLLARRFTLAFGLVLIGLHVGYEILEDHPTTMALLDSTMVGNTLTLMAAVVVVLLLLPRFAVLILPTRRLRRSGLRDRLEGTLRGLGLDLRRVHLVDTGSRIYNAALVGAFPSSTRLLVTDGFVEVLRPGALRGVLAHEIGHDRCHHVAWLLVVGGFVPVVWIGPFSEWLSTAGLIELAGLAVLGLLTLLGLNRLMHRFEHEADLESARLLGSGEGVLEALSTVLKLHGGDDRTSFRHPSVARRTGVVVRWESDPAYRQRFARRGRRIRVALLTIALVATAGSVVAHVQKWPNDQLSYALTRGDFDRATTLLSQTLEQQTDEERRAVTAKLLDLCRAAATLQDGPFEDHASQLALAERAESAAEAAAAGDDLASARIWLEIATSYGPIDASNEAALALLDSLADEHTDRRRRVADHLLKLRSSPTVWSDLARETANAVSSD